MLFTSTAMAQETTMVTGDGGLIANILPLIIIFAIFYFLLIRPQHKKMKAHDEMVKSLGKGDEVVTGGGIIGKISKLDDNIIHVDIAKGVTVKVDRHTITTISNSKKK